MQGIIIWIEGAVLPIILLGGLFYFRAIGAGDIKLFCVIGSITKVSLIIQIIIVSFLVGAVMSIIHIIKNKNLKIRLQYLTNYISKFIFTRKIEPYYQLEKDKGDGIIHFTVAIFIGTIFVILKRGNI